MIAEIMGYLASVLLAISLVVNNDLKFRWVNMFGCMSFIVYGIMINQIPIILTNSMLLLINLFYLVKIYRTNENFDMVECVAGGQMISKFIQFHHTDVRNYFPEFNAADPGYEISFVVLRDMVIANLFVAKNAGDGNAEVKINYTVPKYRDYKVGRFIFEQEKKYLIAKGVKKIVYTELYNKQHEDFLKVMGFAKELYKGNECYVKSIG
jgi:hypothetical protein